MSLPELKAFLAKSEAEKLARTRKRHAKKFAHLCGVIRALDRKIGTALLNCTPQVREAIRADISNQEDLMLDALTPTGPSPLASLTTPKSSR